MTPSNADGRSVEERLSRLEDIEAIKDLKTRYAHHCDDNYNPDGIASLFTENGVWEATYPPGKYNSREEIRTFFQAVSEQFIWALHFMIRPSIELAEDGQSADARWYLLGLMTMQDPGSEPDPVVVSGIYEDRYVKQDGEWLVESMKINMHQMSNWDLGWVKQLYRGQ